MPDLTHLLTFALVALGMVLTPGPNMIYLVSRSISQGPQAGLISLGGVAVGFIFYVLCAAFGITALLLTVPLAYDALRDPAGRPFAVPGARTSQEQPADAVHHGPGDQSAESQDRGDVRVAAAAIHPARPRQRVHAVAGAGHDAGGGQPVGQCRHRHHGRIDRRLPGGPSAVDGRATLADGNGAGGPGRAHDHGYAPLMEHDSGFFASLGGMLGEALRGIVAGIKWLLGGLGGALGDFYSGLAGAMGMSPSIFNFVLLVLGLMFLWAAVKALLRRSIIGFLFWLVLAVLVLGGLVD
ncbi:hypothetical protein G6F65_014389 [Rhizopus arrhizus]|nr:hypothetical protein G6F65_014389 [Rhizopus arrhizus]